MSEPPVDTSAETVEGMICSLHGHPAQAMMRALKRERGELRQRVQEAEKAARVTLDEAQRAGPCFKSILLRSALKQAEDDVKALKADIASALETVAREHQARVEAEAEAAGERRRKSKSEFELVWAIVRAAGGQVVVEMRHLSDLPRGTLHRMPSADGRSVVYSATLPGDPAPYSSPSEARREHDPTKRCREADRAAGRPYGKNSCEACGSILVPGWKCPRGHGGQG